ncbi:acylneuraminate cytidylyltransferase family protein [Dysgonomonas sp. 521]|uniref:acylneuraminate cytidylyltransferase family protein n=1 Tax=Dysgonomonas sp. 521 TaxID=2302932 RepID=UPI0013D4A59F|nr:acylneuraminate cytidylyltransferase family protein [Dysgonomonas sp. 521]NDV96120.1 acylneuraminate cytidylyltransferase family protein [Dysgonomonas sp. 521]
MNNISVFLPCRAGSERIPQKNIKSFAGIKNGLLEIKLQQLLRIPQINKIILSTNDNLIIEYVRGLNNSKIELDIRPEHLCTSATTTDELIQYVPSVMKNVEHVMWTHVTSPMCNEDDYIKAIDEYFEVLAKGYDSLMSVTLLRKFLFYKNGKAVNYDRIIELWPRTQTLEPIYEANSAFFINSINNYILYKDRIGKSPYFYELNELKSFDIDWEEDFKIAEIIYKQTIPK